MKAKTETLKIVLVMEGGILQYAGASQACEIVVVDYDTDGCSPSDGFTELPDRDDNGRKEGGYSDAFINQINVNVAPLFVKARFKDCDDALKAYNIAHKD